MKSYRLDYWYEKINHIDPKAVELLRKFFNEPENLWLNNFSKRNYVMSLYNLLKYTRKPLEEITPDDVKEYFSTRSRGGMRVSSLEKEFTLIRKLLKYAGIEVDFKLRLPRKERFVVDPSTFLTDEEFERLLSAFKTTRDRALIMLLRETGLRIGEALALNVGDVEITPRYGRLHIRYSKTAERYVEFVKAIPYIKSWLAVHPDPKPSSPLFVKLRGRVERLNYHAFRSSLQRALRRAGLEKRVHPHLFRHQVATELLSLERLPEEAVRVYLGWKHGSRMVSRYSHVTSERANELVMRARYGIKTREEVEEAKGYRECPRCSRMVPVDAKYCSYCGLALDRVTALMEAQLEEEVAGLIRRLVEKPELVEKLKDIIRKLE